MAGGEATGRAAGPRPPNGVATAVRLLPPPRDGRVALVSSGSRGLGLRIVEHLAGLGTRVVMGSRSPQQGRFALDLLGGLADRVAVRQLDVRDPDSIERLAVWIGDRLGRCDVLVSIGADAMPGERAVTADLSAVRDALETDVFGGWRLTQAVVPLMRPARYGRVVTMSDCHDIPAHRVARSAVGALTRELAGELAPHGILVNSCCRRCGDREETPVWLATLPDDGPTGRVFCTPERSGRG